MIQVFGRFISRDTFHGFEDDPQSLNQYAYVKGNPVMYFDPTGHASLKSFFHSIVRSLASDLRQNTLTNIAFFFVGGFTGGALAYKAAKAGFTMLERYVLRRSIIGFIKEGIGGYLLGQVTPIISKIASSGNKLINYEGWFDKTSIGKSIDNSISKIEAQLHKLIDTW